MDLLCLFAELVCCGLFAVFVCCGLIDVSRCVSVVLFGQQLYCYKRFVDAF